MKHCVKILAICILIQMPSADAFSEWKFLQWQPFQTKTKLVLQPLKSKTTRGKAARGKATKSKTAGSKTAKQEAILAVPSVKVQRPFEFIIEPVHLPDRIWPDVQSIYLSRLAALLWRDYLWQAGIAATLPPRGIKDRKPYLSYVSKDILSRYDLLENPVHKAIEPSTEDSVLRNVRFSLFNRDMQYINRDIPERDRSRFSSWDMYQSSISQGRSPFEAIGKVFEPKVELGIEF
jgi:hypothetical protein